MKTKLFEGLEKDQEKEVRAAFLGSLAYRKQLKRILEKEISILHDKMLSDENYQAPNWSLDQVDRIAQTKAYKKLLTFLE